MPVVATPLADGAVGVAGPRRTSLDAARSLVLQAVALHSPAELAVCAFASGGSARDWDFLKWLPHTSSPHSPVDTGHLAGSSPACSALADALEDLIAAKSASKPAGGSAGSAGPAAPAATGIRVDRPPDGARARRE